MKLSSIDTMARKIIGDVDAVEAGKLGTEGKEAFS